ncbi:hypothetical protein B0H66DRAFT_257948 [Apodospora peruviana]|uniref:Uncharacterized protein n=1 Tax=Apodospora peruviana TaxID=516989 RepID=A0AAE0I645_9PEZI|nr:hypothetical protein B0H66DRAFT_257948 [Apodospora peruviana]
MESWEGFNYYTFNTTRWVMLMNMSTAEWGVAPFPPNLIAIPGTLANSSNISFPNGTIIIENASKTDLGSGEVEKIVFGTSFGIAALWALYWIWSNWDEFLRPRKNPNSRPRDGSSDVQLTNLAANGDFISAATFRDRIRNFYYENVQTEVELSEKDLVYEDVDVEDVEEVIALVQKMYETDLGLWAKQNVHAKGIEQTREGLRKKSDAILAEVRQTALGWTGAPMAAGKWTHEEAEKVYEITRILMENMPQTRYT